MLRAKKLSMQFNWWLTEYKTKKVYLIEEEHDFEQKKRYIPDPYGFLCNEIKF